MNFAIRDYAKAVAGFIVPGLAVIGTALTESSDGGTTVTASEWVAAALASLGTLTAVAWVRNGEKPTESEENFSADGVDTLPFDE